MQVTPQRIGQLVDAAFAKTNRTRQARVQMMAQFVGRQYRGNRSATGSEEADKASPLNLLHSAVTTMVPNLVFSSPKAQGTSDVLAYRPYAETLALATSTVARQINLQLTLRKVITDAIFFAGFIKTGLAVGDKVVQIEGFDYPIGEPFAERVSPDDIILDPNARDWDEQAFIGNRFRADVDALIQSGFGDPDLLNQIANDQTSLGAVKEAADLGKSSSIGSEDSRRYVDLIEIYVPGDNRVVTLPYSPGKTFDAFIADREFDGPPTGPYHMLGFTYVPDNVLPVAPAGIWSDLHILANRMARKLGRQANRNKRVLAYEDDATEDVDAIAEANDGETVRVSDLNKIKEVEFGGASDQNYEFLQWVKENFSEQAGSMDQLSGTKSNAPSATQAQILEANSSVRLDDMKDAVYNFTSNVIRDIAYYLHTDPLIDLPLVKRVAGSEVQVRYTPEMRQGDFFEHNIKVTPYSMTRVDPNVSVRRKIEFATNVIPAAAQAAMMLGPGFNIGAYLTRMAREVGIEDADEWLNTAEMQVFIATKAQQSAMTGDPGKAATGGRAVQPVPTMTGPAGGIPRSTEVASGYQEAAGEGQSAMKTGQGV